VRDIYIIGTLESIVVRDVLIPFTRVARNGRDLVFGQAFAKQFKKIQFTQELYITIMHTLAQSKKFIAVNADCFLGINSKMQLRKVILTRTPIGDTDYYLYRLNFSNMKINLFFSGNRMTNQSELWIDFDSLSMYEGLLSYIEIICKIVDALFEHQNFDLNKPNGNH
jgi:hypothetical protein